MLSIGIFTYSTRPRGSVVHAACLAEALVRKGAQVTLYALSKAGDSFYRSLSCTLRLISAEPAPSAVDALIRQRVAEFQVGIQSLAVRHSICHAEDCLAANALVAARADLGDARLVRTVHHVEQFESPYLMACQERSVSSADLVLSVSQATSREVHAVFGREAPVISNGVELSRFARSEVSSIEGVRSRIGLTAGEVLILSVGGVEERKNTLDALDAVALAFCKHRKLRWVVAGGASIWEHESYRSEFARRRSRLPAELQARICVLGSIPEPELTALYQLSDILLCPSLQEGFGLCVLEALASRTAVVVSQGAPFDEYLDERCARFVDPLSPPGIAGVLSSLIEDSAQRRRLTECGYQRAQSYSWDLVAERHVARYESLLRQTKSAAQPHPY